MTHTCHAKGCSTPVQPRMLMCGKHWSMVPKAQKDAVWANYRRGQEVDKRPTTAYLDAADAAIRAVYLKERAKRVQRDLGGVPSALDGPHQTEMF